MKFGRNVSECLAKVGLNFGLPIVDRKLNTNFLVKQLKKSCPQQRNKNNAIFPTCTNPNHCYIAFVYILVHKHCAC